MPQCCIDGEEIDRKRDAVAKLLLYLCYLLLFLPSCCCNIIHEGLRRSAFSLLKFAVMFDTKHNLSQAKDKERLIRLTFQGCFLVSFTISQAFYLNHDYIFFFSYFYTLFIFPFLFWFLFHFSLIFRI